VAGCLVRIIDRGRAIMLSAVTPSAPEADVRSALRSSNPCIPRAVPGGLDAAAYRFRSTLGSIDHPVWPQRRTALAEPLVCPCQRRLGYGLRVYLATDPYFTGVLTTSSPGHRERAETVLFAL